MPYKDKELGRQKARERYHRLKNDPDFKAARGRDRRKYVNKRYRQDLAFQEKTKRAMRERYQNDPVYREAVLARHRKWYKARQVFGTCPICLVGPVQLVNDHCHWTGKDRERICRSCNAALGLFKHDPRMLRRAAEYVERHYRLHTGRELVEILDAGLAPGREST